MVWKAVKRFAPDDIQGGQKPFDCAQDTRAPLPCAFSDFDARMLFAGL